jgi:hypothetical protein
MLDDWYGLANATAMLVSVLVRAYVLKENRDGLDNAATLHEERRSIVKAICLIDEGNVITMFMPENILYSCLLQRPRPPNLFAYKALRWVG